MGHRRTGCSPKTLLPAAVCTAGTGASRQGGCSCPPGCARTADHAAPTHRLLAALRASASSCLPAQVVANVHLVADAPHVIRLKRAAIREALRHALHRKAAKQAATRAVTSGWAASGCCSCAGTARLPRHARHGCRHPAPPAAQRLEAPRSTTHRSPVFRLTAIWTLQARTGR